MQVNTEAYNWVQLTKFTFHRVSVTYCIGASAAWDFLRGLISAHSTYQAISNVTFYLLTAQWRTVELQMFVHRSTLSVRGHSCWNLNLMVSVGLVGFQTDWRWYPDVSVFQVLSMGHDAVSSQLLPQLGQYWLHIEAGIGFRPLVLKTEMPSLTECDFIL